MWNIRPLSTLAKACSVLSLLSQSGVFTFNSPFHFFDFSACFTYAVQVRVSVKYCETLSHKTAISRTVTHYQCATVEELPRYEGLLLAAIVHCVDYLNYFLITQSNHDVLRCRVIQSAWTNRDYDNRRGWNSIDPLNN